jgi:hypothetical protein
LPRSNRYVIGSEVGSLTFEEQNFRLKEFVYRNFKFVRIENFGRKNCMHFG